MAEVPLIVGVGNALRGDDGAGPWVAEQLAARGLAARVHAGDGTGLIDLFQTAPRLLVIDAMRSGGPPGEIRDLDALAAPLPAHLFHYSTHRFGLAEAVETARALGLLPRALRVIGIEGATFAPGQGLSPPVQAAAGRVVAMLAAEAG